MGASCFKLQFPHFENEQFVGLVDVIQQKYIRFQENDLGGFTEESIPESLVPQAIQYRDELAEQLAEVDNTYSDLFLEVRMMIMMIMTMIMIMMIMMAMIIISILIDLWNI